MATVNPVIPGAGGDSLSGVSFERVDPVSLQAQNRVISLLLTGYERDEEPSVPPFIDFLHEQNMNLDNLWLARRDAVAVSAALVVGCTGRTAMLFMSPICQAAEAPVSVELVRTACAHITSDSATLIQSLIDPDQTLEAQVLSSAGFWKLAVLSYMHGRTRRTLAPLELDKNIKVVHYSDEHREIFKRAILASYEGTLDCPRLRGLREIDDIIDGHLATGSFNPMLWFALRCDDEPVGVMLLNPSVQVSTTELVYLGLSPKWRGRGIAKQLLAHGMSLARQHGAKNIMLAVDESNAPAMSLYKSMRFNPQMRKVAMLFTLNKK
jgi:ribosomal protein S18 acetylase RimI-like enzyme